MGNLTRIAILCLLISQAALGQAFTLLRPCPAAPPAPFTPLSIPGAAYYWHYVDLPANSTITSWTDRVSGLVMTNGDSQGRPTNSSLGVSWGRSVNFSKLTNSIVLSQAKFSIFILFRTDVGIGSVSDLLGDTSSSVGFFLNGSDALYFFYSATQHFLTGNLPNTAAIDFVFVNPGTGSAGAGLGYTNGVATATVTDDNAAITFKNMGTATSANGFLGYTKVFVIWTNTTLSTANVASLHTWAAGQ